jgi:hypothetical protein
MPATILESSEARCSAGYDGDFIFVRVIFHGASNSQGNLTLRLMTCYWPKGLTFAVPRNWSDAVLSEGGKQSPNPVDFPATHRTIGCKAMSAGVQNSTGANRENRERKTPVKNKIHILSPGLVALLLSIPVLSLRAAPPQTGIRGETLVYVPGFWVEVSPGLWLGDGGFSFGWPASFAVLSAHSGREVAHVSTAFDGSFEVSLPPGKYVVVPDAQAWYSPTISSFEVTVTAMHYTDAFVCYVSGSFDLTPGSP